MTPLSFPRQYWWRDRPNLNPICWLLMHNQAKRILPPLATNRTTVITSPKMVPMSVTRVSRLEELRLRLGEGNLRLEEPRLRLEELEWLFKGQICCSIWDNTYRKHLAVFRLVIFLLITPRNISVGRPESQMCPGHRHTMFFQWCRNVPWAVLVNVCDKEWVLKRGPPNQFY